MSSTTTTTTPTLVGIVGYGSLGQYLAHSIIQDEAISTKLQLAFVWNRSIDKVKNDDLIQDSLVLEDLSDFSSIPVDIIVEVAHPSITKEYGPQFIAHADYFVGSPTCFADQDIEDALREAADSNDTHGVYVPSGAFWGSQDIQKMASRDTLTALKVTMKKHPGSIKVVGQEYQSLLDDTLSAALDQQVTVFSGSVRDICPIAPNNVNTMACAAIAAHNLGFDNVQAELIADTSLNSHEIEIQVDGLNGFSVKTQRHNPAKKGAVTGNATYASFLSSLLLAQGMGNGVHLC